MVSTVLFDNTAEVLHDRVDLEKIRPLTEKEYFVGGCTALLDAVGGAIHHIGNVHKYARMEDVPERTLFVIITDGEENASRYYSAKKVKGMIERQKSRYGWEFLFLGANIDAVQTAGRFGISEDRAVNYNCDSRGTMLNYQVIGEAISVFRNDARIDESWKRQIDEDYKNGEVTGNKSGRRRELFSIFIMDIFLYKKNISEEPFYLQDSSSVFLYESSLT